jgi:hypothetical protein
MKGSSLGGEMKKRYLLSAMFALTGTAALAAQTQTGTIISETSVACGSESKKGTSTQLLCQEYVVRTDTTEYHVRQEKSQNQALIPVNASVEFTLDKSKMKIKANGKKFEYVVVSESAITAEKR